MLKDTQTGVQVTAQENETLSIQHLEIVLASQNSPLRFIGDRGEEILLPESVYNALRQVVRTMAAGQAIAIVPHHSEFSTQEAADFLNISRPYLIKLLEQGKIPYTKVGSHRRVRTQDVLAYKKQRDTQRRQQLSELTTFLQDEGFYDCESPEIAPE
ncbi:MAG: helix-turn-helix domain-containing protein [Desertifilum sp. SIO1I2]|nr:helix-turn-helix domain-containing protein [Desertifilum sp. SIO1I2]